MAPSAFLDTDFTKQPVKEKCTYKQELRNIRFMPGRNFTQLTTSRKMWRCRKHYSLFSERNTQFKTGNELYRSAARDAIGRHQPRPQQTSQVSFALGAVHVAGS
eukprot:scaffold3036_cov117-Cylindrotheca_fusiformis.AAC.6